MRMLSGLVLVALFACSSSGPRMQFGGYARMIPDEKYLELGPARTFEITYIAHVKDVPDGAKQLRMWLPVPQDTPVQTITDIKISREHEIVQDMKYGNHIAYIEIANPPKSLEVTMTFTCRRSEQKTKLGELKEAGEDPADAFSTFLGDEKLTRVTGKVKKIAEETLAGKKTVLEKAHAIFDAVRARMKYDKSGQGWGLGDIEYACDVGKGNCTDFHVLFMALCRSQGIPAGFEIGLYLPYDKTPNAKVGGYHCWSLFRVPGKTWVPVDCSEANNKPELAEFFFGNHTNNRVTLSVGRDLVLSPKQAGAPLNYFVNPYAEVDGKELPTTKDWSYKDVD